LPLDPCAIDVAGLSALSGVELICDATVALDVPGQVVATAHGGALHYAALSIDVGSASATASLAGEGSAWVPIRPIERFATEWTALIGRLRATRGRCDLNVLNAGAAGVELAYAARQRARAEGWTQVRAHLVGEDALPALPMRARHMALALLRERGTAWHGQRRAVAAGADGPQFQGSDPLRSDATRGVTGSAAASAARTGPAQNRRRRCMGRRCWRGRRLSRWKDSIKLRFVASCDGPDPVSLQRSATGCGG
jgi:selenide,water dikinase